MLSKPLTDAELATFEASRDIGAELFKSVQQMLNGETFPVQLPAIVAIRAKTGLSQVAFANLIGTSVRTVQAWEQGRREPTGAAKTLLRIADRHPEYLRELAAF